MAKQFQPAGGELLLPLLLIGGAVLVTVLSLASLLRSRA